MSSKEVGIEEARKILGDLVTQVTQTGADIILTRRGRPLARITPLEPTVTYTSTDLRRQVTTATDASDGEYDVDAIVDEIIERHGAVDIDTLDSGEFWDIVGKHATR